MTYPERFSNLPAYAWPRLRALLDVHEAGGDPINMTIGEPQHPFPSFVADIMAKTVGEFAKYPKNEGAPELLAAICGWITRRYSVDVTPDRVMALNGTREGLYNAMMALSPETKNGKKPAVLMPNPFYQVYAIAALSVSAEPVFVPATAASGHLPDYASLDSEVLDRTTVAYICSPANPQGAVATREYWAELIALAEKHDFMIFADECYSEIYRDTPPMGVLEAAADTGCDPERIVAFHSLSKRSNLPGLRSGFVVSGPKNMAEIRQLRGYAGAPLPMPIQRVSEAVWSDEDHVIENRALYQAKFNDADEIFAKVNSYTSPEAGFFLWLAVEDGEAAALKLWQTTGVRVLPGAYLSRPDPAGDPGAEYIRVALVAPRKETQRGLTLIRDCLYT
ncbi:aminotransferase class I/II-fold pyridoxal phosphate-dependent enzyme [Octadecabacter sp. 1_MG-2023]|uniref:aminotransferase class I/II-fold pyridoxal phosphate-dependent enzyme n=1 Tax=unclassified Octadecabacter TaxID=196158 RepID=UPI001C084605|nr:MULTISPECIES: aminotransferase class I/II-fold pyridoxal phosphate-dependent enzyme [unclassified Octadecabacter]MBU2992147.1 aminotransferase class I/II-fold pyridoxal phosphate-dependent enzyme [Octadecabacter sp. B2R22]MDO6735097.1 aminotransferase class I/II-fold pyridoxal phosphate-dependent enzyme [Octadecabacter sp. 1_MG-2023]